MGSFKIGLLLKIVSWLVAALVMIINGYLLLDFFSGEAKGVMLTSVMSVFIGGYVAFIIYLVLRDFAFASRYSPQHKQVEGN